MVRVNTRISKRLSDWLDSESDETGLPKSTIILLALEQYMTQREAINKLPTYIDLMERMERLEQEKE